MTQQNLELWGQNHMFCKKVIGNDDKRGHCYFCLLVPKYELSIYWGHSTRMALGSLHVLLSGGKSPNSAGVVPNLTFTLKNANVHFHVQ